MAREDEIDDASAIRDGIEGGQQAVKRAREAVRDGLGTAREKIQTVSGGVGEKARVVTDEVKHQAGRAAEYARERYETARDGLRTGYARVRKDGGQLVEDVNVFVRDNPGRSILIAAGVGFVIGLLVRGRRRSE
jgi:ElaB/YqjD/DUF883 family membrane-anchored ribosome-binding protein